MQISIVGYLYLQWKKNPASTNNNVLVYHVPSLLNLTKLSVTDQTLRLNKTLHSHVPERNSIGANLCVMSINARLPASKLALQPAVDNL